MHDDLLFCDLETFSPVPINHGTHRYAEGSEVLLWTYAVGDGPVGCWDPTADEPMPAELADNLDDPERMTCWHNGGMFDTVVLPHALGIDIPLERTHDTLVQALSHSLPGALGTLCEILKIPATDAKDKRGKALIRLFCMPQPDGSRATRLTHPREWTEFKVYAGGDILAMRQVYKRVPMWNYRGAERELWQLDQRINRRGMCIDLDLANAAVAAVAQAQKSLAARTVAMTDGAVQAATQRDALLRHILEAHGVNLPDLQKATLERRINDPDLPIALRELLAVRLQASTSSTAKYTALIRSTSTDGRLRGTKQFNGAMRTGRWAGRLFQPDNLPRPGLPQGEIDFGIEALKAGCADLLYSNVMKLTSSAIRGCIVAPEGKKVVVADLSNIEGRDQAWLAGETWKLQAFRDFDAGDGPDLYKLAYSKSFGIKPADVSKDQRQVGKVQELALGYEGGVGAFVTFAAVYGIDLETLPAKVLGVAAPDLVEEARNFLAWTVKQKRSTFGLSDDAFVACETLKRAWRGAHPAIVDLWCDLAFVVRRAIDTPGATFNLAEPELQALSAKENSWKRSPAFRQRPALKVRRDGAWLRIVLPSGRALCYPSPQLDGDTITYMGVNQYSRKWSRLKTYGGKLFENICQAVARDVMAANMPAIEAAGYEIVLTVHDEVVTEAPETDRYTSDHLSTLLATNPTWALDMPLAAAGFETPRYKKD